MSIFLFSGSSLDLFYVVFFFFFIFQICGLVLPIVVFILSSRYYL